MTMRWRALAGVFILCGCSSTTSGLGSDGSDAGDDGSAGVGGSAAGGTGQGASGGDPAGGSASVGGSAGEAGSSGVSGADAGSGGAPGDGGVDDPCAAGAATVCGANMDCSAGGDGQVACACSTGFTDCSGTCVDLQSDAAHCGACDYACATTLGCTAGACDQAVAELVVGFGRSCALLTDPDGSGSYPLRCWGDPSKQFFRGTPADPTLPSAITGIARVRGAALGDNRFCVIDASVDKVSCWGDCVAECEPDVGDSATVVDEAHSGGVSQIAVANGLVASRGATCSVAPSGQLLCWGFSEMVLDTIDRTSPYPIYVEGATANHYEVRGTTSHFCSRTFGGKVACWGDTFYGYQQWGIPTPTAGSEPTDAQYVELETGGELAGIAGIGVGAAVSCAVTSAGDLYCWGDNSTALFGLGNTDAHVGAVKVPLSDVAQVTVGSGHACAVQRSGQLYCWGSRFQVGLGATAQGDLSSGQIFGTPQAIPGMSDIVEVKASWAHVCARRKNGEVLCWGSNDQGELGDGTQIQRMSPVVVQSLL